MNKRIWTIAGGTAALCTALIAAPGFTAAQHAHVVGAQEMAEPQVRDFNVMFGEEGGSWLGVETREVTSDNAKELKLPGERGVVLGRIAPDSPASKSGLRENDVVTEINGQQVEGAMQFRRMIREIPAGRNVQLTVWRDGHTQKINVTLGKAEELRSEHDESGARYAWCVRVSRAGTTGDARHAGSGGDTGNALDGGRWPDALRRPSAPGD